MSDISFQRNFTMTPQLAQLIAKLQEIFQINQPDLDFGIYRILNSRQTQINEFLQKTLPNKINAAFNGNFEQANNVYNHLYTFFSRYYDQGDFISQRRYKDDTYAIPYAGEEVMLHWANKDQYYTKSGESFSNYAFTLENGKKVQFRLVEADTAKDNRKDNEQARVFALIEPRIKTETDENGDEIQTDIRPIEENGDLLTIRFEYKAVNKKEKQSDYITQAMEKIQNFAISDEFQGIFDLMPTEKNKNRTLLEKYLTDYTAKNTADYFIHKNLGKFLNQELDFYIKNEVMNLDNIQDSTDFSHIEQNLQTIKTIKTVAKEIIAFLAQLEDFQKKLWLKKKFVAGCHYLITLDHLNEAQVQVALENPKQTAQWRALFNVKINDLNTAELCKNYPHLVVDTALFEPKFQADVLNNLHDLDEKTNGLLIHSDNFQALNLLQERYKEQVKCIYIDPPFNLGMNGDFLYKTNYLDSSWLTLLQNRIVLSKNYLTADGVFFSRCDYHGSHLIRHLQNEIFSKNFRNEMFVNRIFKNKNENFIKSLPFIFDYLTVYSKTDKFYYLNPVKKLKETRDAYWRHMNDSAGQGAAKNFFGLTLEPPVGKHWKYSQEKIDEKIKNGELKMFCKCGFSHSQYNMLICPKCNLENQWNPKYLVKATDTKILDTDWSDISGYSSTTGFSTENAESLLERVVNNSTVEGQIVMDFFLGSGTTAAVCLKQNRKFIGVEVGEHLEKIIIPRVCKTIASKKKSSLIKILKLESYEDTLNNLELKQPVSDLFTQHEALQNDYLLHYMLDVESRDSLLNTQHFTKPFDYQLNIATTSAGAYEAKTIDLVETFNYLIGLRVSEINDKRENGLVMVQGINTSGEKTLVIWRDCEKYDYDKLNHYLDSRDINPQDSEFDVVYINGDHNVPTVFTDSDDSVKTLKVRSIEAEFLSRMFG